MKYSPTRMVGASPSTVPLSACESGPDAPITLCGREVRRTRTQTRRSGAYSHCRNVVADSMQIAVF